MSKKKRKDAPPLSEFLHLRAREDFGNEKATSKLRGQARILARKLSISPQEAMVRIRENLRKVSLLRKQVLQNTLKKIVERPLDRRRIREMKEPEINSTLPENPYRAHGPFISGGLPSLGRRRR